MPRLPELIRPVADDPDSGYDADCCACLRGRIHACEEHAEKLRHALGAYNNGDFRTSTSDESACMGSRD